MHYHLLILAGSRAPLSLQGCEWLPNSPCKHSASGKYIVRDSMEILWIGELKLLSDMRKSKTESLPKISFEANVLAAQVLVRFKRNQSQVHYMTSNSYQFSCSDKSYMDVSILKQSPGNSCCILTILTLLEHCLIHSTSFQFNLEWTLNFWFFFFLNNNLT